MSWCCHERWGACYLFQLEFSPDLCPGVELLDHMAALFLCVFFKEPHTVLRASQVALVVKSHVPAQEMGGA